MNKKKLMKIISIIAMILLVFSNCIAYGGTSTFYDPAQNPDMWQPTIEDQSALTSKAGDILKVINTVGIIGAVIVLMILGIKYMLGSLEEKADYKKAMVPYIIGIVVLVTATTLPNLIYTLVVNSGIFS